MLEPFLDRRKKWLQFGTEQCRLMLNRSAFSADTVSLRNDPLVNQFIHNETLSVDAHEAWLAGQDRRKDSLNFAIVKGDRFMGTVSLIRTPGCNKGEIGRFILAANAARVFAPAADFLVLSFGFDVLALDEIWCVVGSDAPHIVDFRLSGGWAPAPNYDCPNPDHPAITMTGLAISASRWAEVAEAHQRLVERMLDRTG